MRRPRARRLADGPRLVAEGAEVRADKAWLVYIWAVNNGYLDDVPVAKIRAFESGFLRFMAASHPEVGETIARDRVLSEATIEALKSAIAEFKQTMSF